MSLESTRSVTFRQAVGMAGAAGAAMLLSRVAGHDRPLDSLGLSEVAQAQATACVLTPTRTLGPYFVDERLNRSDIRAGVAAATVGGQSDDEPRAVAAVNAVARVRGHRVAARGVDAGP